MGRERREGGHLHRAASHKYWNGVTEGMMPASFDTSAGCECLQSGFDHCVFGQFSQVLRGAARPRGPEGKALDSGC